MAVKNMNFKEFNKNISDSEKLTLVDFWAPWCVYCRRIGPAFDKIAEQFEDSVIVGKVNIDEETKLAEQERIEVIPTLVLYKNGEAVDSIVEPESKAKIEEFVRRHLAD